MSNRPRRRHRVITAEDLFPKTLGLSDQVAAMLGQQIARSKHDASYEELGPRMGEVHCTCGYVAAYTYGEPHALRLIENHYAMFHVIADPIAGQGAKYREGM